LCDCGEQFVRIITSAAMIDQEEGLLLHESVCAEETIKSFRRKPETRRHERRHSSSAKPTSHP
jgi:hypothetical protein